MDFFCTVTFTKEALDKLCAALKKQEDDEIGQRVSSRRSSEG
jgi:hypothetical protein